MMSGDENYDWDKAARMRVARAYMGLNLEDMADQLGVNLRSYKRWESGMAAIPTNVWGDVENLLEKFDDLIDSIIDRENPRIAVPRKGESMLRAVSIAVRERPELEPYYEDQDDDA